MTVDFKSKEKFPFKVFATEDKYMIEKNLKYSFKTTMKTNYSIIYYISSLTFHHLLLKISEVEFAE